jgi:hypothetical protein
MRVRLDYYAILGTSAKIKVWMMGQISFGMTLSLLRDFTSGEFSQQRNYRFTAELTV